MVSYQRRDVKHIERLGGFRSISAFKYGLLADSINLHEVLLQLHVNVAIAADFLQPLLTPAQGHNIELN